MHHIFSKIKKTYQNGDGFTKLLYLNISFFIIYSIVWVPFHEIQEVIKHLAFSSKTEILINKPWTFISYMFIHVDLLHILSNMIFLHFGSKLFLKYFNSKQLISTYIFGGICGAILFKVLFNLFPEYPNFDAEKPLIGASAGVFAIMIAVSTYKPNHLIQIPFLFSVKLKQIAWFAIILFYLGIGNSNNPGGHIAHIGGAIFGYLYIKQLQKQNNFSINLFNIFNKIRNIFNTKKKIKPIYKRAKSDYEFNSEKAEKQKEIDKILDKIAKSGYDSLSKKDKETLFSASKK